MNETHYIPEQWVMLKDNIYAAQRAIRIGLEHIDEVIANNEKHYPDRQIVKYLEILKNEKLICEQALEGLLKPFNVSNAVSGYAVCFKSGSGTSK